MSARSPEAERKTSDAEVLMATPDLAQIEGLCVRRDIAAPPLGSKLCVERRHLRLGDIAKNIEASRHPAVMQDAGGALPAASGSEGGAA